MKATVMQARLLLALRGGPGTAEEVGERAHDGATPDALRDRLRRMEEHGWVRRSDERADGSHVWQITRAGREAARENDVREVHEDQPSVAQPGEEVAE